MVIHLISSYVDVFFLQLKVDFSYLYDRVPHPDRGLETSIENVSQMTFVVLSYYMNADFLTLRF